MPVAHGDDSTGRGATANIAHVHFHLHGPMPTRNEERRSAQRIMGSLQAEMTRGGVG